MRLLVRIQPRGQTCIMSREIHEGEDDELASIKGMGVEEEFV
jgi:hypothetical protein